MYEEKRKKSIILLHWNETSCNVVIIFCEFIWKHDRKAPRHSVQRVFFCTKESNCSREIQKLWRYVMTLHYTIQFFKIWSVFSNDVENVIPSKKPNNHIFFSIYKTKKKKRRRKKWRKQQYRDIIFIRCSANGNFFTLFKFYCYKLLSNINYNNIPYRIMIVYLLFWRKWFWLYL